MNSFTLKAAALRWLRYERGCVIVSMERPPVPLWFGVPDVIGVTYKRELIEIEVKTSVADFRNNAKKECMLRRAQNIGRQPNQFYFLVPTKLVEKIRGELPEGAGLMSPIEQSEDSMSGLPLIQVNRAAAKRDTKAMTMNELVNLVKDQSGTMVSMAARIMKAEQKTRDGEKAFDQLTKAMGALVKRVPSAQRCAWQVIDGVRTWLPRCMGGAVAGPDMPHRCTCGPTAAPDDDE